MRLRIASWFMVLCLVMPASAQILPAPTSEFTASDSAEQNERSGYNESLDGGILVRNDKMTRKMVPLVTTYSQQLPSRVSLAPPLTKLTVTASPRSHALRVHQLISVYRI